MIVELHEAEAPITKKVIAYCDARLQALRELNDNDKSAVETAHIRGQIAEMKRLRRELIVKRPLVAARANPDPYA